MKIRTLTAAITLLAAQVVVPAGAGQPTAVNFGLGDLGGWIQVARDYLDNTPSLTGSNDTWSVAVNPGTALEPLTPEEEATLVFMREEEKMARDVYLVLFDQWGVAVFENIALRSEQQHMDMMRDMLDRYGIADPVTDDTVGVFVDADLANLYQELVERGTASLEEALMVGALIEEVDILDLMRAIEETSHPDLIEAYENLMLGSRNHLRAFVGQLENLGIVYEAQLMEQELVDEILESPMERGTGSNNGHGISNDKPITRLQDNRNQRRGTTPGKGSFSGLSGFTTGQESDQLCIGIACYF